MRLQVTNAIPSSMQQISSSNSDAVNLPSNTAELSIQAGSCAVLLGDFDSKPEAINRQATVDSFCEEPKENIAFAGLYGELKSVPFEEDDDYDKKQPRKIRSTIKTSEPIPSNEVDVENIQPSVAFVPVKMEEDFNQQPALVSLGRPPFNILQIYKPTGDLYGSYTSFEEAEETSGISQNIIASMVSAEWDGTPYYDWIFIFDKPTVTGASKKTVT